MTRITTKEWRLVSVEYSRIGWLQWKSRRGCNSTAKSVCLVDFLQDVTQRNVPLPKMKSTLPLRFEASSDRQFVYFGRKKFVEIVKHIDRNRLRRPGVRLLGNVGSGKSHLLAAYALYLQMLSSPKLRGHSESGVYPQLYC
jgi:predicted ATPase